MFEAQIKWTLIDYYLKTDIFISRVGPRKATHSEYLFQGLVEWLQRRERQVFDESVERN